MNRVPMSNRLVWAQLMRPQIPLVYLDINHFIYLARATEGDEAAPHGYVELLAASRSAAREQRAVFPLSCEHLWELSAIRDPKQRTRIADVMEELSGFNYLLGRAEIAQLEIDAGIRDIFEEPPDALALPLIRPTFGWAFGMRGGMSIRNIDGSDATGSARQAMGREKHEQFIRHANYTVERAMLDGPRDEEIPLLRSEHGYAPEAAREGAASRLAYELDLSERLAKNGRWRRGRLRDVVSAREIAHEWLDAINRVNEQRVRAGKRPLALDDDVRTRQLMAAMPQSQVAISIKSRYHRDSNQNWTTNDITDIDAMSVAYAYCDAVFTDKAVRAALANSTELRVVNTYLPRTPVQLAGWLDRLPHLAIPDMLVPHPAKPARCA